MQAQEAENNYLKVFMQRAKIKNRTNETKNEAIIVCRIAN